VSLKTVYLSVGSNLGDREDHLRRAIEGLDCEQITVKQRSSVYETEPQELAQQPWFLNMVLECETRLFPLQLLSFLQRLEHDLGRVRAGAVRKGPRIIDIDILLFGQTVIGTSKLAVPHPRMFDRRFVLEPLIEIAPGLRHPVTKEPLTKYLGRVKEQKLRKIGSLRETA
jgi:2-amino-4-hydroxy-6-hydroxymethyldihydropteridine diphosphokinase